ncbi:MAG: DUF2059 domain-containing protein, partial [Endozoicomonas sp.]
MDSKRLDSKRLIVVFLLVPLLFLQLLFSSMVYAVTEKDLLLDKLYDETGLERQLNWIHDSMTLQQQQLRLPETVVETVNQVVEIRYSPNFFRSSMKSTLDEALSMGELSRLIRWFESSLGQKILRLESAANDPANQTMMEAYIEEKLSQGVPRNFRLSLIEELMDALNAIEFSTELAASASAGAQRMLQEVMPSGDTQPIQPAQIIKAQEKPHIRKQMPDRMRNVFLFTYRSLPDQELQQYIQFARE